VIVKIADVLPPSLLAVIVYAPEELGLAGVPVI
jgi:hypothetical protein